VLRADPWKDISTLRTPIAVYSGDIAEAGR